MSRAARRYFGCLLPLLLAVFGCGTMALAGYAGRIVFDFRRIADESMSPPLVTGWTVMVNNAAYWAADPAVGEMVTVGSPDGWAIRRIVAVPGETIEVRSGAPVVDGVPRDPGYEPRGTGPDAGPVDLGDGEYFVMADDRDAADSRTWGPIPRERVYGRAIFQIDGQRTFHEVTTRPTPRPPRP